MRDDDKTFRCELLTAEGVVFQTEAASAIVPVADGMVGVMAGREPLLAALAAGRVLLQREGRKYRYYVSGGVMRFCDNVLTVLAERCQRVRD